eukprot:85649-Pleurochrysis_carterae.AAC.2
MLPMYSRAPDSCGFGTATRHFASNLALDHVSSVSCASIYALSARTSTLWRSAPTQVSLLVTPTPLPPPSFRQSLIGSELALRPGAYTVRSPLVELPLYVGLGILSGVTAIIFERVTSGARALFRPPTYKPAPSSTDGSQSIGTAVDKTDAEGIGGGRVLERRGGRLSAVPVQLRPALGGLFCGAIGFAFPQARGALPTCLSPAPLISYSPTVSHPVDDVHNPVHTRIFRDE